MAKGGIKIAITKDLLPAIKREMEEAARLSVAVGAISGAGGDDGHGGLTNAQLLGIHEFGTATIPERAPIRTAFDVKGSSWATLAAKLLGNVLGGKTTAVAALGLLGQRAVADIRRVITARLPPPLKDATVARKGSSVPLVDTGQLLNSITYVVRPKGGSS